MHTDVTFSRRRYQRPQKGQRLLIATTKKKPTRSREEEPCEELTRLAPLARCPRASACREMRARRAAVRPRSFVVAKQRSPVGSPPHASSRDRRDDREVAGTSDAVVSAGTTYSTRIYTYSLPPAYTRDTVRVAPLPLKPPPAEGRPAPPTPPPPTRRSRGGNPPHSGTTFEPSTGS